MTLERADGTRIEVQSGTQFDYYGKRAGAYDAVFYLRKEGAKWEEARDRLYDQLQARLGPDIVIRRRDPAFPRLPAP